ncbi:hypothetical protein F441_01972 [Phytophthora nicotianae CJ01A1]|uniref:Uncharacterized protein n=2 Tax=Phytophthora nicotianae TaxID=4792 RepID=W2J7H8_PHYNI|nr:hypothetical protein L915_01919 [Phytophthora nicotianae]ETL42374.1 hypothetical protein L916_06811 [Phytophthora nicotianae]ETP25135.1 hypothetical protein F441_01972 [Phytophthora nicotianae CJ01A1]
MGIIFPLTSMAPSAYQLWLKKREFKAPRQSPSPTAKPTFPSSLASSKDSSADSAARHEPSQGDSAKFHAVSSVETTQVVIKSVARPSEMAKRRRVSQENGGDVEERSCGVKVAGRLAPQVEDPKVAGRKRQRNAKEGVRRTMEKIVWSGRAIEKSKVAEGDKSDGKAAETVERDDKVATQVESYLVKKQKMGGENLELIPIQQRDKTEGKRRIESANDDNTTKRLRFDTADSDDELSELPPKSPMKKFHRKLRTAMLDESQYWMAVDRFSHLT